MRDVSQNAGIALGTRTLASPMVVLTVIEKVVIAIAGKTCAGTCIVVEELSSSVEIVGVGEGKLIAVRPILRINVSIRPIP